ncbi:MAG: TIGR04282 family arsenosugar biosynthesis glycosyltransferase [Salibacteraceae bacterium]
MTANDRLIIFVRKAEKGQLKKRLVDDIGSEQALVVHHKLQLYTKEITRSLNCEKAVYYADQIDHNDLWDNMIYDKGLQQGDDRGMRMNDAFSRAFADGKQRVIIIGTDCIDLESYMIKEAFAVLESNDVVIGPAKDGGYYLLGMKKFLPTLLTDKDWNSDNLLMDTLLDLKKLKSKYYLLKTLNDINSAEDLDQMAKFQEKPEDWF